jgi:hypothetical protein
MPELPQDGRNALAGARDGVIEGRAGHIDGKIEDAMFGWTGLSIRIRFGSANSGNMDR